MMSYTRSASIVTPVALMAHRNASSSAANAVAGSVQHLVDTFTSGVPSNASQLIRESINAIDDGGDSYRTELMQKFLPVLIASDIAKVNDMATRYSVILCGKLIGRNHCDELAGINGFIAYVQNAMHSKHHCISRPAIDAMMKLVAYAPVPERMMTHSDIDHRYLTRVAVDNLSSKVDANRCLDAIRVLTILNQHSCLSPDSELCEHLVETFYDNNTPFVSKQTAGLILTLTENDNEVKLSVKRLLTDGAAENKPIQAARCWQEVSDVMAFIQ